MALPKCGASFQPCGNLLKIMSCRCKKAGQLILSRASAWAWICASTCVRSPKAAEARKTALKKALRPTLGFSFDCRSASKVASACFIQAGHPSAQPHKLGLHLAGHARAAFLDAVRVRGFGFIKTVPFGSSILARFRAHSSSAGPRRRRNPTVCSSPARGRV